MSLFKLVLVVHLFDNYVTARSLWKSMLLEPFYCWQIFMTCIGETGVGFFMYALYAYVWRFLLLTKVCSLFWEPGHLGPHMTKSLTSPDGRRYSVSPRLVDAYLECQVLGARSLQASYHNTTMIWSQQTIIISSLLQYFDQSAVWASIAANKKSRHVKLDKIWDIVGRPTAPPFLPQRDHGLFSNLPIFLQYSLPWVDLWNRWFSSEHEAFHRG